MNLLALQKEGGFVAQCNLVQLADLLRHHTEYDEWTCACRHRRYEDSLGTMAGFNLGTLVCFFDPNVILGRNWGVLHKSV